MPRTVDTHGGGTPFEHLAL